MDLDLKEFEEALRIEQERYDILENEYQEKGKIYDATLRKVFKLLDPDSAWDFFMDEVVDKYPLTKAALTNGFRNVWIYGRWGRGAWNMFKRIGLKNILKTKERKLYESLPKMITIYRGMHKNEVDNKYIGFSWTLERGIAEWFAFRGADYAPEDGRVYSIKIRKSQILALFLERNEVEVVYPYANKKKKSFKLVTDIPTEAYWRERELKSKQYIESIKKIEERRLKIKKAGI